MSATAGHPASGPPGGRPGGPPGGEAALRVLRRLRERRPPRVGGERCELCMEPLAEEHRHLVDMSSRSLACACRGCALLFTHDGAAGGRYRAVPDRYRYVPSFSLTAGGWDELQIPVGMAFFFYHSDLRRYAAFYPSPGGATESLLPLETWQRILAANPEVADVAPDVEALLLRRTCSAGARGPGADTGPDPRPGADTDPDGDAGADAAECYLVPIDACYDLVGRVRTGWRGFHGGSEVWREIDGFFARLRQRSVVVGAGRG